MILSKEEVQRLKECVNADLADESYMQINNFLKGVLRCVETIEAQQQEIISLRNQMIQAARGSAGIVDLASENVALMTQAVVMRKQLEIIKGEYLCAFNGYEEAIPITSRYWRIKEALSIDSGKAIGGEKIAIT